MLKPTKVALSVKDLHENYRDKIRFDLAIQRNTVWDIERKSLFIHSLLYQYPVPPIYAVDSENQFWLLDGKQRISTILSFLEDGFALSEETPDLVDEKTGEPVEIAEFMYSQLPDGLREDIRLAMFEFTVYKELSDEDRDEMFLRLNNGAPLKAIELTRVLGGSKLMEFVQEVAQKGFFQDSVKITDNAKNRFVDEEIILQILALLHNDGEAVELSSKNLKSLASDLKDYGLDEDMRTLVLETADYLTDAFPVKLHPMTGRPAQEKFLKKVNIPMLFVMATRALENGIAPEQFGGWAQEFFYKRNKLSGTAYNNASSSGSAKKENVSKRLEVMGKDFEDSIDDAPEYEIPEPKITTKQKKELEEIAKAQAEAEEQAEKEAKNPKDPMWSEDGGEGVQGESENSETESESESVDAEKEPETVNA